MSRQDLHHIVRAAYIDTMTAQNDTRVAFHRCVGLLKRHRPDLSDDAVRKEVVRMIATDANV